MPGMGGMGMDDDDDDMDMPEPTSALPEGVKKEILKEGDGWKNPKKGDEVTVHYVGTLESDGSEFDSSRSRNKEFSFTLGEGQVISGWDLGVATMKKGELAKFTLAPEHAYGEEGSPPKIPAKATLIFEVELISWVSKDDVFGDGGVIKSQLKEGSGWKKPKLGDEVCINLKVCGKDGNVIQEKSEFEYIVGSDVLGPIAKAVDKVLTDMNKGEETSLLCTPEYAGPDGEKIDLTLIQLYDTKDVSLAKNKSLMKKQVLEGEGYDTPKDGSKVSLSVVAGSFSKKLDFTAGNGDVCDALECAVAEMKLKEKAQLTVSDAASIKQAEEQLGMSATGSDKLVLALELEAFEKAPDTWNMSEDEKLEHAASRKDAGGALFKAGRYRLALERYKKVISLFSYLDSIKDEDKKTKAKEFKKACELNSAACNLKFNEFADALKNCDNVLKEDSLNVKALFRRAQANLGLKEFGTCMADLKKLVEVDPQNREARSLMKEAQAGQKEEDKKSKGLFAKMCGGLGKGPIRPPGKDESFVPEDDEEEEKVEEKAAADEEEGEPYPDIVYGAAMPERLAGDKMEKKMKKIIKEGGKRGVEIEGAADMGGLQFFCTTMAEPNGDVDLLYESLKAMNAKSDPGEEERKGGSGRVGKMLVSPDQDNSKLALVAYCPPAKQGALKADQWMKDTVAALGGGEILFSDATTAKCEIKNDADKGLFVLKLKDSAITESINYLKGKGLFPDNKDDDDSDFVFGDDDFPTA